MVMTAGPGSGRVVAGGSSARTPPTLAAGRLGPWARLVSNQRPLACEASALPLSYAPGNGHHSWSDAPRVEAPTSVQRSSPCPESSCADFYGCACVPAGLASVAGSTTVRRPGHRRKGWQSMEHSIPGCAGPRCARLSAAGFAGFWLVVLLLLLASSPRASAAIYWTDLNAGTIGRASLDGRTVRRGVSVTPSVPSA